MADISIAKPVDLREILQIDKEVLGNGGRKLLLSTAIREQKCIVAKTESSTVGFLIHNATFFDHSFISLVIVHPLERQKGYAKKMMSYFECIAPTHKIFSSTNQSNENMQKVFSSLGYVKSGFIENLDEGDPELVFFKQLHGPEKNT